MARFGRCFPGSIVAGATAEHVERQVAVTSVVAVKELPLLISVQRVVGRIQVEDDLLGCSAVGFDKEVDEQPLDRRSVMTDPVIAARGSIRSFV
jgi:hypothetical protein